MSAPAIQVLLGFGATPSLANLVTLNRSVLDGTDVLGGGTIMVDVSPWLSGQVSSSRGRSREIDMYQAGSLTFMLRNEDRRFDPTNTASPYYPGILPRAPVSVFVAGQQVFGGYVDDYDLGYGMPSTAEVTVSCLDGFTLLATAYLSNWSASAEFSGQRIQHVLQRPEIGYPASYSLDTGLSLLQASTQNQNTALDHCQAANSSENGMLFCDRFGVLQFHDRTYVPKQAAAWPNGQLTFTDAGTAVVGEAIAYQTVGILSATTLLFNRVQGTATGGLQQTANDPISQAAYNIRTLALPAMENQADTDVNSICQLKLLQFSQPEVRFDTIGVEFAGLSAEQQPVVAALDLGSVVVAVRTPPGGGSAISQLSMVEKIDWTLDVSGASMMVVGLMNLQPPGYLILNDATYGILNTDTLYF